MSIPTIIMVGDRKYYALFEHNKSTEMAYLYNHVLDDWDKGWFLYNIGLSKTIPPGGETRDKLIKEYGM